MTDKQIQDFIKYLIIEKRMKTSTISQEIGIDTVTLWSIRKNQHKISLITRDKIIFYAQKIGYLN